MQFKQLVSFLCLCVMGIMSGCGVEHKWIQQDKGKYLVYTQPPIDVLRQNPTPEPTYCTKLVDVEYDPPLPVRWYHKIIGEPDRTFKGCGTRDWEQKEGVWLANVHYDTSLVEKIGPMISGAAFMAGTMGAAAIFGGHVNDGLKNQRVASPVQADVSTFNQFAGPVSVTRPVGR